MSGNKSIIQSIRKHIHMVETQLRARIKAQEEDIAWLKAEVDKLIKPAHVPPGTKKPTNSAKLPVPVPPRPDIMAVAEVGQDPQ